LRTFCLSLLLSFVFLTVLPSESKAIVGEKLLNQAGLKTAWQNAIAMDKKEKVQKITVLGDYLYILTDNNYLFCLDRNTGKFVFGLSVAAKNLPVFEPVDYNDTAYIVAGNNMVAVDLQQGAEVYRKKIPFPVSARAAVNSSHFYFAGRDNVLRASDLTSLREIFRVGSIDAAGVTSIVAVEDSVFFATKGGSVVCMAPAEPKRIWQFETVGPIEAPLTKASNWLYASGRDTNLYKLNAENGGLAWKFQTGSVLTTSARVTEKTVYQYAINKGLYAIDAESGEQIWLLPDGLDLLAQDGKTAYIFDKNNTCLVMDNKQAKNTHQINFTGVTNFAVNSYDSNIYIMKDKNISCIKPIKK
jgi:outer membrane protein assembly factor BamB